MTTAKNKADNATNDLLEEGLHLTEEAQAYAKETWNTVQDQTGRVIREGSVYVRENPFPIAIAAFGVGLVIGLILNHHEPPSLKKKYIDKPIDHSHGVLLGLVSALNALLSRNLHSASNAAEELSEDVSDSFQKNLEPLANTARRAGRKLGL